VAERDHKQRTRAAFDRQAPTYDRPPGPRLRHERLRPARAAAHACGIDLSAEMIAKARERLAWVGERAGGPIDPRVADAEHLPLADDAVDLVVCADSLHHYPDPGAALLEMRRVAARQNAAGAGMIQ